MRILIVGAGIAGLAITRAFQLKGIAVTLVERAPSLEAVGSGILIYPNGTAALHELGLVVRAVDRGSVLKRLILHEGMHSVCVELSTVWAGSTQPTLGISRPALQQVLSETIHNEDIRLAHSVDSIAIDSRSIAVGFSNGSSLNCDLLVAADGVRSGIRRLLNIPTYRCLGLWYLRFSTRASLVSNDESHTYEFMVNGTPLTLGLTPLGNGLTHVYVQLTAASPRFNTAEAAAEWLRTHLAPISPLFKDSLEQCVTTFHFAAADESDGLHWHSGRVAFIGDAAHAISPTFQESASLGMEDAVVLAEFISRIKARSDIEESLARYENFRKERVCWAAQISQSQVRALLNGRARSGAALSQRQLTEFFQGMYAPLIGGVTSM